MTQPRSPVAGGETGSDFAAEMFHRYNPPLRAYCYALMRNMDDADDLAQDAWLRVVRAGINPDNPHNWLFKIAANIARDKWRHKARYRDRCRMVDLDDAEDLADLDHMTLDCEALQHAIGRLTGDQAQVVRMRLDGYAFAEIAQTMDKTTGAVKALQHRGVHGLRQLL